ncbi:hypothetical protein BH23GEM4_BH23GEM4_24520 [soil metagenome]
MLVGMGLAEVSTAAAPLPRWRAGAVGAALAAAPDADIVLGILLGRGAEYHGTFTHSIVATIAIALVADWLGGRRWALLAGSCYGSHLLVDLLDDRGRTNVLLGWPFTSERPFAIARVFPPIPFAHGGGPGGAFASLFTPEVLEALLRQTAVAAVPFCALLLLAWGVRRVREMEAERCS